MELLVVGEFFRVIISRNSIGLPYDPLEYGKFRIILNDLGG